MSALLELEGVVRHFPVRDALGRRRGAVRAVDGVSLSIAEGEVLAVVGESGCGKSTLGRLALWLEEPDAGAVRFAGQDLRGMVPDALRRQRRFMQMIFQDPYASLDPRMTVGQAVAEPLRLHRLVPRAGERARVQELLARVGLRPEHVDRWPHEFSGGQRQRIAIARALASGPRLIVGDEPVSALDVSVQAQVINLLQDLIREFRLAFVLISHDLAVVRHVADRVVVMYLGRIVEEGPAGEVFAVPRHPYTRALLASVPGGGARGAPLQGDLPSPISPPQACRFHTRCPHVQEICRQVDPPLAAGDTAATPAHRSACHFRDTLPPLRPAAGHVADGDRLARLQAFFAPKPENGTAA
ncbi:ABC transporter ATP-binding protein [Muricoccus pecuniae]|uniref:Peptide/nickel transport system ATP-binding protein/oligopeptide transport system ATP-binding protein n=1 Tax=Muricoccus pecuniae TaxID=693023 RepID=A0A840YKM1_9PROT|nr:oligopeptide/dipeptide ABC transporter ATP-binding protein [Roseomonas pecuniae]MBB5695472.1 peptide/nickel transport system ATP-binding protein/oligopeptide transport system ATP-binding protein [Roseomonas pecuniae]